MTRVLVAVDEDLALLLARCGVDVAAWCDADQLAGLFLPDAGAEAFRAQLDGVEAVVVPADHVAVDASLAALCDGQGVRIVAVADDAAGWANAQRLGIACADAAEPWGIVDALDGAIALRSAPHRTDADVEPRPGSVIAVWGPGGAPGRSTVALLLAAELARGGRRVALVDADTHTPSLGMMLGLPDEGPGFAAACRAAAGGMLDARELDRIAQPLTTSGGAVDVLCGINRPGRWPELEHSRVMAALDGCRQWADYVIVDVAASLERDEEIVSDLEGPRRNAATLAALAAADAIVAVGSAEPVGVSRLLRALAELRGACGATPVRVVVNRHRSGALGVDGRGQLRRALERFAGVEEAWFLPWDQRATDAAILGARPVADVAPRSPLVVATRRFVGEALIPALGERPEPGAEASRSRGRHRGHPAHARVASDRDALVPAESRHDDIEHTVLPTVLRPRPRARGRGRERRSA